jgi:radical SAM family uncharacterized protein
LTTDWEKVRDLLDEVSKPTRYIGAEYNIQTKEWSAADLKVALAFPDLYEIGQSHLGLRILYELINSQTGMLAERVFAPWPDYQQLIREHGVRLHSLENKRPLSDFDVIGFSLQYELSYTNILIMLSLSGIPLLSKERSHAYPIIIGGGPCAFNPEPVADFFDLFLMGEAEDVLSDILIKIKDWKRTGAEKKALFSELEMVPGIYIPSNFQINYDADGCIKKIIPKSDHGPVRAVTRNFKQSFFPKKWLVPYIDIVHDRIAYEIQRGCTKGCRFCQAGMIYRPVRERTPETIMQALKELSVDTGYEELSLTSLSSADYSRIQDLMRDVCGYFTPLRINVSLPSLRVDSFSVDLAAKFQGSHKSSLTFAPEAGTDRLRRVINKGITDADLLNAATAAFQAGWQKLKLYFMIGLPTETDADIDGIIDLVAQVLKIGKHFHPKTNSLRITVSVSTFVPKAHTPFQWRQQISVEQTIAKQEYLQARLRGRHLELNWHNPYMSLLEGVMARGDRRLSEIIKTAWRKGAQFDSWGDQFQYRIWLDAFQENEIDPNFYIRERAYPEVLPWSHLHSGVNREFLIREDQKAERELTTLDCRDFACAQCGVCPTLQVNPQIAGEIHV